MTYSDLKWTKPAEEYLTLLNNFVDDGMPVQEYRDLILRQNSHGAQVYDDCPVSPVISELVHDANEFIPTEEYRDSEDMSEDELRIRASFARDVIRVSIWFYSSREEKKTPPEADLP